MKGGRFCIILIRIGDAVKVRGDYLDFTDHLDNQIGVVTKVFEKSVEVRFDYGYYTIWRENILEVNRLSNEVVAKVLEAIDTIERGVCKRIDVNDRIKVYAVKNVIRIDIKEEK